MMRYSRYLVTKEEQIKIAVQYHLVSLWLLKIKKPDTQMLKNMDPQGHFSIGDRSANWYNHCDIISQSLTFLFLKKYQIWF